MWQKLADEIYHERQELSSSQLRTFMRSPNAYMDSLRRPKQATEAMKFGTAAHLAILQPNEFGNQVLMAPECDRRTKEGKAVWEKFNLGLTPGTVVLKEFEYNQAVAMANEVTTSDVFKGFAARATHIEVAGFADLMGVRCRVKPDMLSDEWMLDYKTTTCCTPAVFERSILSYGYAIQAAFYLLAAEAIDGKKRHQFYFLAQEKHAPYDWRMFLLDSPYLIKAKQEVSEALGRFALCSALNDWPKYAKTPNIVSLPRWFDGTQSLLGEGVRNDHCNDPEPRL